MNQPQSKTRCPGCRRLIGVIETPTSNFDFTYNAGLLQEFLEGNVNQAFCSTCQKIFRCETELLVFHEKQEYAIMVTATKEPKDVICGKALLLHLFGHTQFRFRAVRFCIEAMEKVRLFEHHLDDRAIEWIKYQYCPAEVKAAQGENLLLYDGIVGHALSFRVFDDFDQPTDIQFSVPLETYRAYSARCTPEPLDNFHICWKRINDNWASRTADTIE